MGKSYDTITPELSHWIEQQHIFFVATAPLADDGLINCSPKGMDTFRILGPREVAYLDLAGSGIETVAHSRENGRIVFMFCSFDGPPQIVRLHGTGEVYFLGSPQYDSLSSCSSGIEVAVWAKASSHRTSTTRLIGGLSGTICRDWWASTSALHAAVDNRR